MSGFGDGYVGTAQDAMKIRRLEKLREAERWKSEELKSKNADGHPGLLQFGSSTSEILETAFKKETCGLVTREQYVEKELVDRILALLSDDQGLLGDEFPSQLHDLSFMFKFNNNLAGVDE
ncbi:protein XAP5 CIRCADIAN TIMEKEEPER [Hordeum vulgare]|nr:protein XAP5 CIRCADIAN TIMEKEEPER [Hordeum vulgare]